MKEKKAIKISANRKGEILEAFRKLAETEEILLDTMQAKQAEFFDLLFESGMEIGTAKSFAFGRLHDREANIKWFNKLDELFKSVEHGDEVKGGLSCNRECRNAFSKHVQPRCDGSCARMLSTPRTRRARLQFQDRWPSKVQEIVNRKRRSPAEGK